MGSERLAKSASILVLLAAVMLAPGTASAGGQNVPGKNGNDPASAYSVPMPEAYPFPGFVVDSTCTGCSYAAPIFAVYQCPAVIAWQPGSQVEWHRTNPMAGLLGGRPYLYHP
ncbi:MAG: hypothetical protein ACLQIB_04035 [Isosphaeraceae bacterium]